MVRFVLLSTQRSGTTLLRAILDANPNVRCLHELCSDTYGFWDFDVSGNDLEGFGAYVTLHAQDMRKFVETHGFPLMPNPRGASGFTLMYDQPGPPDGEAVWNWLADQYDLRVIHLHRQNELLRYVSLLRANSTAEWYNRGPSSKSPPIVVDPYDFLSDVARVRCDREDALNRLKDHSTLSLSYEELVDDPSKQAIRVFEFLDVESSVTLPQLSKQGSPNPRTSISNYQELCRRLAGTTVEKWLSAR